MTDRTLAELARLCGAELIGDGARRISGPASLREAVPGEISFLANPRYRAQLETTRASAVVVGKDARCPRADLALLRCADPNAAFTDVVRAFAPPEEAVEPGVHPSAVVDPTAELGEGVSIGACAFVGRGVRLGERVVLHPCAVVQDGASVGEGTVLFAGVVLYPRVSIGARCRIHAGAVIGSDGFGFDPSPAGWVKVPQCGTVRVEDDVEIGANATIARARFGATRIGRGAKVDNLVHIGHNVEVEDGALLVAQVGVSGSSRIGRKALLGGQVGVNGHITIGDGARVAAQAGVFGDLPGGADYLGFPARPRVEALRALAAVQRVPRLLDELRELERRVRAIEEERG